MARKKQEIMVLFPDLFQGTKRLNDAQFGMLVRALYQYRFEGTEYAGEDASVAMAFDFAKPQIDRYKETCEINRKNKTGKETPLCDDEVQRNATESHEMQQNTPQIKNQNQNYNQNHNQNQNQCQNHIQIQNQNQGAAPGEDLEEREGMIPDENTENLKNPSVMEISKYCREAGLDNISVSEFCSHYILNDWKDQNGQPIRDWKALARSWDAHRGLYHPDG